MQNQCGRPLSAFKHTAKYSGKQSKCTALVACQNKECIILCKYFIVKSCKIVKQKNIVKQIYQKAWKNKARILSQELLRFKISTFQIYAGLILFHSKKLSHIWSTHTSIFNSLLTVHVLLSGALNLHTIFMQSSCNHQSIFM